MSVTATDSSSSSLAKGLVQHDWSPMPDQPPTAEQKQTTSTDVQHPAVTTSTDSEQPAPGTSTDVDREKDFIGYDTQIDILTKERDRHAPAMETPEQQAKREKREKAKRKIAAISDGIRALSNLYFTSQYAPNMYNHEKDSQLAKEDALQEKLKAEREAGRDKFLNYSLKIGDLQNEKAKTARELEANAEKRKLAREAAARAAEEHGWNALLQPERQRKAVADANTAESKATTAKAEADNAPELQKAKLNTEQQRGKTEQSKQANNRAAAAAHGRRNTLPYKVLDKNGNVVQGFATYDQAVKYADLYHKTRGYYTSEQRPEVHEVNTPVYDRLGNPVKDKNGKSVTKTTKTTIMKNVSTSNKGTGYGNNNKGY